MPQREGNRNGMWKVKAEKTVGLTNSTGTMTIINDLQDL